MAKMFGQNTIESTTTSILTGGKPNFINPLPNGEFKSGKGIRWGRMHNGIDLSSVGGSGAGSPIYASATGKVKFAGWGSNSNGYDGYGNIVVLDHGGGWTSRYAHLTSMAVKEGDTIKQGDQLGIEGSTGLSTGTHLHFEIRKEGSPIDPAFVIKNKGEYSEFKGDMDSYGTSSDTSQSQPTFSYDDIGKALKTLARSLGLTGKKMKPEDLKPKEEELSQEDSTLIVNIPVNERNHLNNIVVKPPSKIPKNGSYIEVSQGVFA